MNRNFAVSNTTSDISHIGPLIQELSLDKNGCITLDQTLPTNTGDQPLTIAAIKQAALGSSVTIRADPSGTFQQDLTLNLPAGGVAGDIASALVSELGLNRQNDGVSVDFVVYNPTLAPIDLTSTDPNILGPPLQLYGLSGDGITTLGIELATVGTATTPPVIRLSVKTMSFSLTAQKVQFAIPIGVVQDIVGGATQLVTVMTQAIEDPAYPNTLSGFDPSTGLFTAPETGVYAIHYQFRLQILYDTAQFSGDVFIILRFETFAGGDANQLVWRTPTLLPPPVGLNLVEYQDTLAVTVPLEQGRQMGFRVQRNNAATGVARLNGNPTSGLYTGVTITRIV
jgi:hypothetical protein